GHITLAPVGERGAAGAARGTALVHYFDSSALAKLILAEAESAALIDHMRGVRNAIASELSKAELMRAVGRVAPDRVPLVSGLFKQIDVIPVTSSILTAAGQL